MTALREVFGAPFNWCDRRCERCPLASECPVQRREQQQRWVHQTRGLDPDDPAVMMQDVSETLASTLRMLLEFAEAEGIDLDAPLPPRPIVLDAKRLTRTSKELARCVAQLSHRDEPETLAVFPELKKLSFLLAMKSARIAGWLEQDDDDEDEEGWTRDAVPNLLLLDHVKTAFAEELARLSRSIEIGDEAARALAELDRVLDPLIRDVCEQARAALAMLQARGAAPSPFVVEPGDAA